VEAHALRAGQSKAIAKDKRRCIEEMERETVMLKYVTRVNQIKYNIANKVREAANRDTAVREVLRGKIVLPITQETIFNSFKDCNLSGMYELLHQTYSKASFVGFSHDLMNAMTYQATGDATPTEAVKDVDALISLWNSMEYWKYMTPDLFFTCTLLRGLRKASFSAEIAREAAIFLQSQENGESSDATATSSQHSMPLYRHVSRFIKVYEDSSRLHIDKGVDKKGQVVVEKSKQFQHGLEQAAVAAVAAAAAAGEYVQPGATGGRSTYGKPYTKPIAPSAKPIALEGPPYKVCVGRQHHALCRDTNDLPYTATQEPCAKCHGEVGGKFSPHTKKCFPKVCFICRLYGHGEKFCDQHTSTYQQQQGMSAVDFAARVEAMEAQGSGESQGESGEEESQESA
jgi:hypothetical protein